jgi:tetratricopeptide (TPR) repeat protein
MTTGCALTRTDTSLKTNASPKVATSPETADAISSSEIETEGTLQCTKILQLSQAGEHKNVVELADKLIKNGDKCPDEIMQRIDLSRSQLKQADACILKALQHKREGKLLETQTDLKKAIEVYPKYYWAHNLLKKVKRSINAQLNGLLAESRNLESSGDLRGALSLIQDAIVLSPDDNDLKLEAARLQDAINRLQQKKNGSEYLKICNNIDPSISNEIKQLLQDEDVAKRRGPEGEKYLQAIQDRRRAIIKRGFLTAQEAEQAGDLESAADHTMYVLQLSSAEESLTSEVVEFARLLGLKLFSAGNFSRARDLWKGALRIVPDNVRLQKYLAKVEERLDNLKKIRPTPSVLESQTN